MSPFLEQIRFYVMFERRGVPSAETQVRLYIRTRLQHSPPFAKCHPTFIRDLREYGVDGPLVPCPEMAVLLDTLTDILLTYGVSCLEILDGQQKRRELREAHNRIRQAIKAVYPRNTRILKRLDDPIDSLEKKIGNDNARLELHGPELRQIWRQGFAHFMFQAFQTFGPPRTAYPHEAVYVAIATIYNDLKIEQGNIRALADRIRKRCEARRTLD
jgi:hypothetical protein